MRRVTRGAVSPRVSQYLSAKQMAVNTGADVEKTWNHARRTKTVGESLLGTLRYMSGSNERCMYCNDSRGVDIEHFWPKVPYPNKAFAWQNLLLCCTGCNRQKGDQFPLDAAGDPLFVDPTSEEPWQFLNFVPKTGELTPCWNHAVGDFDAKGKVTTDAKYLPLNYEAVVNRRLAEYRRLRSAVTQFIEDAANGDEGQALDALLGEVQKLTDFGLDRWIFHFGGQDEQPFSDMRTSFPDSWGELQEQTCI